MTDEFRTWLMATAEEIKVRRKHPEITADHVKTAYDRITAPVSGRSEAQRLITTAFRENRLFEWTGYVMAVVLFLFGTGLWVYAVVGSVDFGSRMAGLVGGSVAEILLVFSLRFSINARRQNFALRILGFLLDRVDDPVLLADCIRRLLGEVTPPEAVGEKGR